MKRATLANGELVYAEAGAPTQALCPDCGQVVYLRSRRQMGSKDRTYFWQHERGTSPDCGTQRRVRRPAIILRG